MTTATPIFDQLQAGLARTTDPHTSHTATRAAQRSTAKEDVRRILSEHGPLHDRGIEAIHDEYVRRGYMAAKSGQRLRTARHELVQAGLVRRHLDRGSALYVEMPSGYASTVWEVAS